MPKILRIINRFNLGGPTYNASYLTKYLSSDFETLLVGGLKDEAEGHSEYIVKGLGIEPVIIPEMRRTINPTNDLKAYRKLSKLIKKYKPDIVHTHASKAGTLGRLAAFANNVPLVLHTFHGHVFHSYFSPSKTQLILKIERGLAEKSTKIIAISDKQKDELANEFFIAPENKIEVVPLGFDLQKFQDNYKQKRSDFRKKYCIAPEEIAIGIVGRLTSIKNHKLFIDAIAKIKKQTTKKLRIFIIGDGELKDKLLQQANQYGLQTAYLPDHSEIKKPIFMIFTSWIKNVDAVYPGLDIIAMTSLNEGTPVSLIEAQASNTPIVSTNVGGIENIVIPQKTALLTKNDCLEDFSEKLLMLVENDEVRKEQQKHGWEYVKDKFHYTRLINDMEKIYYQLL